MSKIIIFIIVVLIIILFYFLRAPSPTNTVKIIIKDKQFNIEIATSLSQQAKGLSGRASLCPNCGMLFPMSFEAFHPFWMKDTLIPLDMIWLDKNQKIVTILEAFPQPNTSMSQLTLYKNSSPAKYVLELNQGVSKKLDLKIGDTIQLPFDL